MDSPCFRHKTKHNCMADWLRWAEEGMLSGSLGNAEGRKEGSSGSCIMGRLSMRRQ